ncbi:MULTISPECIES: transposase [Vagococcus]|uniref:transposase n=1 Tax=Vagococcus TaxID=2737 RepID=UPI000B3611C6|nr:MULTISPECIES: transposase [Vagococcus]HCM88359.1 hypothetical protein [Vagococcus sp.]
MRLRIENIFKFHFSNAPLEGSINKIKLIKRITYGYQNFYNYKYRILISFKDKKISNISGSIIYDVDEEIHPHLFFYKKIETYEHSS